MSCGAPDTNYVFFCWRECGVLFKYSSQRASRGWLSSRGCFTAVRNNDEHNNSADLSSGFYIISALDQPFIVGGEEPLVKIINRHNATPRWWRPHGFLGNAQCLSLFHASPAYTVGKMVVHIYNNIYPSSLSKPRPRIGQWWLRRLTRMGTWQSWSDTLISTWCCLLVGIHHQEYNANGCALLST